VEKQHQELTVPVPHSSGYPCGICGRSHELVDAWGDFEGRPVHTAGDPERAACPRRLEEYVRDVVMAEARTSSRLVP
jgi:hypothetical protein